MTQLAWPAVALAALFLFWLPVLVAAIRGAERIGMVVLATLLTILLPPAWFAALALAFRLPGKKAVCRRGTFPPHLGSPAYWPGAVPPAGAPLVRRSARPAAGAGSPAWTLIPR
jgi:hypothetical protein